MAWRSTAILIGAALGLAGCVHSIVQPGEFQFVSTQDGSVQLRVHADGRIEVLIDVAPNPAGIPRHVPNFQWVEAGHIDPAGGIGVGNRSEILLARNGYVYEPDGEALFHFVGDALVTAGREGTARPCRPRRVIIDQQGFVEPTPPVPGTMDVARPLRVRGLRGAASVRTALLVLAWSHQLQLCER